MAIRSDAFGSVRLSGRDAERFVEQVTRSPSNPAAREGVRRGRELVRAMQRDGKVAIKAAKV